MNRKPLTITLLLLLVFTFTNFTSADSPIVDSMEFQSSIEVEALTLEQTIEQMLEDSPTLDLQKLDLEQSLVEYEKLKNTLRKIKPLYENKREDSNDYLQNYKTALITSEFIKGNAERNLATATESLKAQVEQSYYSLLQAEDMVKINQENLELANKLYNQAQQKYELRMITKQELMNSELNQINAQNAFNDSNNMLTKAKMMFNTTLGNEVMDDVLLKDHLVPKVFLEGSIADAITSALTNRNEIKASEFNYAMAKINFDITAKKYPEITFQYRSEEAKYKKALESLENTRKQIEMEIRSNYLDIKQKKQEIESSKKAEELAEEVFKMTELLYNNGMSVITDVQKAQTQLQQAKLGLSNAILDFNLAVLKFEDSINVGTSVMNVPLSVSTQESEESQRPPGF